MPRDLFGDVTRPSISIGTRKWYTVPLSLFTHSLAIGLLIALPLLAPAVMPAVLADDDTEWITITPPTPPPQPQPRSIEPVTPAAHLNAIPLTAPEGITPEKPRIEAGFENQHAGPGFVEGVFDSSAIVAPPLPEVPQKPIRVGGTVRQPQKVRDVKPVYPQLALISRVDGVVIIEATIGADGRVVNARVLRSAHLLDNAALEAVRQWEFTPTLLNGVPVPVIMTVTVAFQLDR
jgi:TonB family protein